MAEQDVIETVAQCLVSEMVLHTVQGCLSADKDGEPNQDCHLIHASQAIAKSACDSRTAAELLSYLVSELAAIRMQNDPAIASRVKEATDNGNH